MSRPFKKLSVALLSILLLLSCTTKVEGGIYSPHTEAQSMALEKWSMTTLIAKGDNEFSKPMPFVVETPKEGDKVVAVRENGEKVFFPVIDGKANIVNLYIGESYTYYVLDKDGKILKEGGILVSPEPPRNLDVDGVTNFRDIGGWSTDTGKKVKQGLVYRCARLSENETGEELITDEGKETITSLLGIKNEIDLRKTSDNENGSLTRSPAGDGVGYISLPFETGGAYLQKNLSSFPRLFEILGNEENYPLLYHCSIGTDRTGAVTFVLLSLLGVDKDDIYRDYLFSNFGYIQGIRRKTAIDDYLLYAERFPGENLKERVWNMLIENGVDNSDIENFISIMTENY